LVTNADWSFRKFNSLNEYVMDMKKMSFVVEQYYLLPVDSGSSQQI